MKSVKARSLLLGLLLGLAYGLFLRACFDPSKNSSPAFQMMSVAFLFLGPLAIGAVSAPSAEASGWLCFFWPTLPVALACLGTWLLHWEGLICIVMYLPLGVVFGGIGGLLGRFLRRRWQRKGIYTLLALPLLLGPIESSLPTSTDFHEVRSQILIHAPARRVWEEIKSVRTISRAELPGSWVQSMGFPRPVNAEIDHEGIGGIRLARFSGDLVFHETVTAWKPEHELAFRIEVDPKSIPPTTLDEHVTIGGPFFDVLFGTYELEPLGEKDTLLHLRSVFRLSTHFNAYAAAWSSLIMNRIQSDVLSVEKARAEN